MGIKSILCPPPGSKDYLQGTLGQNNQGYQPNYYPQGYPEQVHPPHGYPPQGYPPHGYPPQGYSPQGYPPQGYPPHGYPPQGYPPQDYLPQGFPPQGHPPHGFAPQSPNQLGLTACLGSCMACLTCILCSCCNAALGMGDHINDESGIYGSGSGGIGGGNIVDDDTAHVTPPTQH